MRRFVQRFTSCLLVLSLILSFGVAAQADGDASQPLSDINQSYARSEIEALVSVGVLSGYEDGSFQPAKLVTRAELAKILVIALGLKVNEEGTSSTSFKDVAASSWYAKYVDALVKSGITQGTSQDEFSPDANVTREELVVFLTRALGLDKLTLSTVSKEDFADLKEVSDWAKNAVILASEINLVNGEEGPNGEPLFAPKRFADRQAIARLAYEVKEHRDAYISKSKEFANAVQALKITKIEAVSNTTVEVTFDKDLLTLDKADFSFDNTLKVEAAAYKAGGKSVVVLTTSSQNLGTEYHLTFRGQPIDLVLKGMGGFFGGGGAPAAPTVAQQLASGKSIDTLTVTASGSYGPASGQTSVGTLILDPGPSGEVTLTNIHADNLQVKSGAVSSIKLSRSTITMLVVNAVNNNGQPVRILALDGAVVTDTSVESQAILESATTTGTLGAITIQPGAAGKTISLRGNIDGSVTNNAGSAQLQVESPSSGNSLPTVIKKIILPHDAFVQLGTGTILQNIQADGDNHSLSVSGAGQVQSVNFGSGGSAVLTVGGGAHIQHVESATQVTIKGDPDAVAKLLEDYPAAVIDATVKEAARTAAVIAMTKATQQTMVDIPERIQLFDFADRAIENAQALGVSGIESNISSYREMKSAVQEMLGQLKALQIQYQPGDSAESVTQNPIFPTVNAGDGVLIFSSDKLEVLSSWSSLQRPAHGAGDVIVHITFTLYKGPYVASKVVAVTVKQFDSKIQFAESVRSDLVLVYFDHPVVNSQISDFQIQGLEVSKVTQYPYPYLAGYALLTVSPQKTGTSYIIRFAGKEPISFAGGEVDRCAASTCPTSVSPFYEIPLPDSQVPGMIYGIVYEYSQSGSPIGLKDATVSLIGTDQNVHVDEQGAFRFNQVPSGAAYTVKVTKAGYSTGTSEEFTLHTGEAYFAGLWYLHTKPAPVTGLTAEVIDSHTVYLKWDMPNYTLINNRIENHVFDNGQEIEVTTGNAMIINNLQPGSDHIFSVKACNDMGCTEVIETTLVRMMMLLNIQEIRPVKLVSVGNQTVIENVYDPLTQQNGGNAYVLNGIPDSANYLRIALADANSQARDSNIRLAGVLDSTELRAELLNPYETLSPQMQDDNGEQYILVKLITGRNPYYPVNMFAVSGLSYTLNGKVYQVAPILFNILNP